MTNKKFVRRWENPNRIFYKITFYVAINNRLKVFKIPSFTQRLESYSNMINLQEFYS